ncbi:DUF3017 domain-containing protein [Jatrophihabitans sp. DSM 45814]
MVRWLHAQDLRETPFLIVLLIEAAAIFSALAAPQHWLRAVATMTIGLVIAGLFRLMLSDGQAGMLRVRGRSFDVACYWTFAALALAFALKLSER